MDSTKGDKESVSGEATLHHAHLEADGDKTDDNNDDEINNEDDVNKEDDGNQEAQEGAEHSETDEPNDRTAEDKDDGDKSIQGEERVDNDVSVDIEAVEEAEATDDNNPEESTPNDADDKKEVEQHEDDVHDSEEETEVKNEEAAEEEERENEDAEEEDDDEMANQTTEPLHGDDTEENGLQDLTVEDITRCQNMFDKKAINGRLDLKGFKTVFRVLGEILPSEEAERMFDDGDKDDDNTIDFEEFCRLYSKFRQQEHARREAILESVDKLFLCGSGDTIELRKVQQLLLKLQQPDLDARLVREKSDLGHDEVKHLVKSLDKHGTGFISKQEFVNIMCQHLDM
ncbi:hypothetical protein BsWGS_24497 [Bradybaena similaris]